MIKLFKLSYFILFCALAGALSSCNKWDDHNAAVDASLNQNLLLQIKANPDLSKFYEYIVKTGYDTVLASSKTLTVWAPNNTALASLDPATANDPAQLKLLVGNQIAPLSYFTTEPSPAMRIRTLSDKNVSFTSSTYGDGTITAANAVASNGTLHIVDKATMPKLNIWEYLNTSADASLQKAELNSLNYQERDLSKSEVIGYDQSTGQPIYKEGVGLVDKNWFLNENNIANEDSVYTYIMLTDDAYNSEKSKLQPYFQVGTNADSTALLTNYAVIKDLAFKGRFDANALPTQLYSAKDSVVYTLDKSAIVKTYEASNGVVFVMNKLNYDMVSKLGVVKIEGENYNKLQSSKTVQIRQRRNSQNIDDPLYRSFFKDLLITNHKVASFWVDYRATLNSVKYKVYFRAVRDFDLIPPVGSTTITPFKMKFALHSPTATDIDYYENVGFISNPDGTYSPDYERRYAGEFTVTKWGVEDVFLVADANALDGQNTLLLDYIELVPVP